MKKSFPQFVARRNGVAIASVSAFAGAIAALGWAPFGWWPACGAAYAALYLLAGKHGPWGAGLRGLLFGLGLHMTGHGWIAQTLHVKLGLDIASTILGASLFMLYLATFTALPCMVWRTLMPMLMRISSALGRPALLHAMSALVFASLLTLGEWARSLFFSGFTSLSFGYALLDTWVAGYIPVGGVYAASWAAYFLSASLFLVAGRAVSAKGGLASAIVLLGGGAALLQVNWVHPGRSDLGFRLIQTDVAQERKFDPLHAGEHKRLLLATIEQEAADLIVTPETVLAESFGDLAPGTLSRLQQFSQRTNSHIFLGAVALEANGNGYNSVLQFAPNESGISRYDKTRLTPFGEYSPAGFGWVTGSLNVPYADLNSGARLQAPLQVKGQSIGALICQEDLVGDNMLRWPDSVGLIINPGNLAWFEGSWHIAQRLQIARVRALESGRSILRVANTGVTAHINHHGQVERQLPIGQAGVLSGRVQTMQGKTPYMVWGDWPVLIFCFGIVATTIVAGARFRKPTRILAAIQQNRSGRTGEAQQADHCSVNDSR